MATDTMKHTSTSAPSAAELRSMFLLDPEVIFLNHGSFGACPKPVFDSYQHWQRELERQPVEFIQRRQDDLIDSARGRLASELNVPPDDVVFVPNATSGLNVFARSMKLQPGDEILATDHEYGALNLTWQHVCARTGAKYVQQEIPLPVTTPEAMIETLWQGVTDRTKVIFLSHLTSPTALIFPVAEICHRAREAGIISIIDGAHAPGQLPLDLIAIGADVYSGNCHKWMCSPKGAAFLYVRPEHQEIVEALTVSWGWGRASGPMRESRDRNSSGAINGKAPGIQPPTSLFLPRWIFSPRISGISSANAVISSSLMSLNASRASPDCRRSRHQHTVGLSSSAPSPFQRSMPHH